MTSSKVRTILLGLLAEVVIGLFDYSTGPNISFAIFYLVPVVIVSWYGGRWYGTGISILSVFIWFADISRSPEITSLFVIWHMSEHLVIFIGAAWLIDYVHIFYLKELARAENQYTRMVETAMEGILEIDEEWKICFVNKTAASVLGDAPENLVGQKIDGYLGDEFARSNLNRLMSDFGHQKEKNAEIRLKTSSGIPVWVLISASKPVNTKEEGKRINLVFMDISARKRSEEELQHHYREISSIHELSSIMVRSLLLEDSMRMALETVLDTIKFDAGCILLLDETEEKLILKQHRGIQSESVEIVKEWQTGRGATGKAAQNGYPVFINDAYDVPDFNSRLRELEAVHGFASIPLAAKGKKIGVMSIISRQPYSFSDQEKLMLQTFGKQIGFAIENARLYESVRTREQQIRQLSISLVQLQEEERKHFARELHDGLSQVLTTLKINAELALAKCGSDPDQARKYLSEVVALSDEAQTETKQIAYDLRPPILDDFGLSAAIRLHASNFERRTGISVELHLPSERPPISPVLETNVYRIVQEILTNVAKHSGATKVLIQLLVRGGILAMNVSDNGKGLEAKSTQGGGPGSVRSGLRNIHERVEFFGGTVRLESFPGRGTEVLMELPIGESSLRLDRQEREIE